MPRDCGRQRRPRGARTDTPGTTGEFKVGRVTLFLSDESRDEHAPPGGDSRTLPVDVWYPAESSSAPAARYFDAAAFGDAAVAERLKGYLGAAYERVRTGGVDTYARADAPFARAARYAPLLLFSHGGGEARETYASQLAELASHGYVVAAITHTYDSVAAARPDGSFAFLTPGRWPAVKVSSIPGLPPAEEANPEQLRWLAQDIRFVMDELTRLDRGRPFQGNVDASRVGAFGHSAGGMAAAHACQIEPRLVACLNQDGLSAMTPYYLDEDSWGMDQAFMLLVREGRSTPPTAAELARMRMSRADANALLTRLRERQELALSRTGSASYRVLLNRELTTHADFGDLPLLNSATDRDASHKRRVLGVINEYTRAFFDKTLRGRHSRLLAEPPSSEFVTEVERYQPAGRGRSKGEANPGAGP